MAIYAAYKQPGRLKATSCHLSEEEVKEGPVATGGVAAVEQVVVGLWKRPWRRSFLLGCPWTSIECIRRDVASTVEGGDTCPEIARIPGSPALGRLLWKKNCQLRLKAPKRGRKRKKKS